MTCGLYNFNLSNTIKFQKLLLPDRLDRKKHIFRYTIMYPTVFHKLCNVFGFNFPEFNVHRNDFKSLRIIFL